MASLTPGSRSGSVLMIQRKSWVVCATMVERQKALKRCRRAQARVVREPCDCMKRLLTMWTTGESQPSWSSFCICCRCCRSRLISSLPCFQAS